MNDADDTEQDYDADDLLVYFEARIKEYPHHQYVVGAEHVREWRCRRSRDDLTQADFNDFMSRVENIDSAGSVYCHLWWTVKSWGYSLGLTVPESPPPHLAGYKDTATCTSSDGFATQISGEKVYDILAVDPDRMLVRIRNDQTKHRWYPQKHFRLSPPPERRYIRKSDA